MNSLKKNKIKLNNFNKKLQKCSPKLNKLKRLLEPLFLERLLNLWRKRNKVKIV